MKGLVALLTALGAVAGSSGQMVGQIQSMCQGQHYTSADIDGVLEKAEQYRREGNFAKSLELHIWYHKNALKYDPAQYGVRLSFALSDWSELGHAYPPAFQALRVIRDETLATYLKDPSDSLMLGEVMSIDLALDDLRSAKSLFYQGRRSGVRDYDLILELDRILQTGDLKWVRDVIGDPTKALNEFNRQRKESLAALGGHKEDTEGVDGLFASQAANLLRAVAKTDGLPAARKLQRKAIKFLDSPLIRNTLSAS